MTAGQVIDFDVIVIGAGHAGTEAACASARIGVNTLLLTQQIETIGQMSCNPAIGGIGKSHLVMEVDALGGVMGRAADAAGIQFRMLNASKGPAVRALRAQCDRQLYRMAVRQQVENQDNLRVFQDTVVDFIIDKNKVAGVITKSGLSFSSKAVVLTTGTFLGGRIHIGDQQSSGGRLGDAASNALADRLRALMPVVGRLKTGTPPRIDGRSIDLSRCTIQTGDTPTPHFSFAGRDAPPPEQIACYLTHTNERTHQIIRENIHRSAMYSGKIEGVGPRYCPSIEDKVERFAERDSHQIFLEPEGLQSHEWYPNGISTSLPFSVQQDLVRSMTGLESAHLTRPGYAIEYDFFDPRQLHPWLETRSVSNLFFAGQINGTTGYEEAAAQGLVAGVNAARRTQALAPWTLTRDQAYIGVLIDDLVTNGTQEPYRMFTSRAEYRLLLRQDNADQRLSPIAHELGLLNKRQWQSYVDKQTAIDTARDVLKNTWIQADSAQARAFESRWGTTLTHEYALYDLLRRPGLTYESLLSTLQVDDPIDLVSARLQLTIECQYAGYISRQKTDIARMRALESTKIPEHFDYMAVHSLSNEVRQHLQRVRPATIGQAGRIAGVTPAAIGLLLIHLKKQGALHDVCA